MHVVFTVGTYYPLFSATARCAKNLVDVMSRDHDVTVVAERLWNSPADIDELGLAERIVYVGTPIGDVRAAVDRRMNAEGAPSLWHVPDRILAGLRYGETFFSRTSCNKSEVDAYLRGLEGLDSAPDQLIPVSLPFSGVVACALYKKRHPGVALTPVIFDQFSESATLLKTGVERRIKQKANLELERMVVEASDRVFAVTWDEHVERCLPDLVGKFEHIEHPMLIRDAGFDDIHNCMFGPGAHAVYAGALNAGAHGPRHLTELFEGYSKREGQILKLHAFAMGDGVGTVREAQIRCPFDIELCCPVPYGELLKVYASADVLVSVGNSVTDQKAGNIIEYMATGKPIVHIASCEDDPVIPELKRYPLGLVLRASDDVGANQDRLSEFVVRTKGRRMAFEEVAKLFPDEVPDNVCDLLSSGGGMLVFAGNLSSVVSPDYVCSLLEQPACCSVRARFFTSSSPYALRLDHYKTAGIERFGWVGPEELRREKADSGQLLSIAEVEGKQISSKIFSYMATGRPIVHIYTAEDDVNVRYLSRYPLALCLKADKNAITDNARRLALWCAWSYGQSLHWDDVARTFGELTPEYVASQVLHS